MSSGGRIPEPRAPIAGSTQTPTATTTATAATRAHLEAAIDEGRITPVFQPIVDMRSGETTAFEVLARWNDPSDGEIDPAAFIARFEQNGLIDRLTVTLIDQACRAAQAWPGRFSLAFNLSAAQLARHGLADRLAEAIVATGFPASRIGFEVTEGSPTGDSSLVRENLSDLRDLGAEIGIDDFGTGYSNLARLEELPFHKLKIDARFVRDVHAQARRSRIVSSTISLGHSLGMVVVAEGVECPAEASALIRLGCDLGQGWFYGRGLPAAEIPRILATRSAVDEPVRPVVDTGS